MKGGAIVLIQNEYFELLVQEDKVVLRPKKIGYPIKSFDAVTRQHPRLKITSFTALQKGLMEAEHETIIGTWLPAIEVMIPADRMTAQLCLNFTADQLKKDRQQILGQVEDALDQAGVTYGRIPLQDIQLKTAEPITVAIGTVPVKGADAVITYIEIPERKPVIREDGNADYYDMNFVTQVEQGDWLGEKIAAKEGIQGTDVFGRRIPAPSGEDRELCYDRQSVIEQQETNAIVLRSVYGGALEWKEGQISVSKHLVVDGDVGLETGSITFDGAVTIYGTVLEGYSVKVTGDISIEASEGVTNAKEIQSLEGDIYIRGGIFGAGETIIEAKGDIFIKHANNCRLYGKVVHVGLYLLGADIIAEQVLVDKRGGKIIGGTIEALNRIECAYAGNQHERATTLHAKGIDKNLLYQEIQAMAVELKGLQLTITKLEQHVMQFEKVAVGLSITGLQTDAYNKTKETIDSHYEAINNLNKEIQIGLQKIKTAIPPEIEVARQAYPGVVIRVGSKSTRLYDSAKGIFANVDGALNV